MAKGQTATETIVLNNMPKTTTTKTVELIVYNTRLVPDMGTVNPGVDSRFQ